jgi:hypothetical protein
VNLLHDSSAGPRDVTWDFLLADGTLAPPGRYELMVRGESRVRSEADSARVYFDLARQGPPILDTLPGIGGRDLLPVRYSSRLARADLATGAVLAAGGLAVGRLLPNGALGGEHRASTVMASAALLTAVVTVLVRRHHPELPGNVAENARRQAARVAGNMSIRQQNADRLNHSVMIVTPASGAIP